MSYSGHNVIVLRAQRSFEAMLSREKETHSEMIRHLKDSVLSYQRDDRRVSSYVSPGPAMFPSSSTGLYTGPVAPTGMIHEHHTTAIPPTRHQHSHRSHRKHCHCSKSPERSRSPHQCRRPSSTHEPEVRCPCYREVP